MSRPPRARARRGQKEPGRLPQPAPSGPGPSPKGPGRAGFLGPGPEGARESRAPRARASRGERRPRARAPAQGSQGEPAPSGFAAKVSGVGFGESRSATNRARFRGLTARESRFSGAGNRPPSQNPKEPPPSHDFPGISGISEISKFRQISRIFAVSELAPRNGSLVWGFRAPGGRIWGVAIST